MRMALGDRAALQDAGDLVYLDLRSRSHDARLGDVEHAEERRDALLELVDELDVLRHPRERPEGRGPHRQHNWYPKSTCR